MIAPSPDTWRSWLRAPGRCAAALPTDPPLRPAVRRLLVWGLAGWSLGALLKPPLAAAWAAYNGEDPLEAAARRAGFLGAGLLIALIWNPLHTLAWGGLFHALLRRLGGAAAPLRATVAATAHATAAATPLAFLPGIGPAIHLLGFPVVQALALRGLHPSAGWRATAAVLIPHGIGAALGGIWLLGRA